MAQPIFRIHRRQLARDLVLVEDAYLARKFRIKPIADLRGRTRLRVMRAAIRVDDCLSRAFAAGGLRRV